MNSADRNSSSGPTGPGTSPGPVVTILASCLFLAIGGLVYNTLPIILGSAADSRGYSNLQLGYLGSAYLAGFAGMPLSAPLWIKRIPWRNILATSAVCVTLCFALSALSETLVGLSAAMFAAGAGAGVMFSVAVTALGQSAQPERAFVASQSASLLVAAAAVWTLPSTVIPRFGFTGLAWTLAAVSAMVILIVPWHPRAASTRERSGNQAKMAVNRIGVALGLFGICFYYVGLAGLWSFLERIGKAQGLDAHFVSKSLSLEKVLVLVTCIAAFLQGSRFGRVLPMVASCIGMLVSALILYRAADPYQYMLGVCLFGIAWTYSFPFQLSVVSRIDIDGRYAGLIPAFMGAGSAAGPALSGNAISSAGFAGMYVLTSLSCVVGTAFLLLAARPTRESPLSAHPDRRSP